MATKVTLVLVLLAAVAALVSANTLQDHDIRSVLKRRDSFSTECVAQVFELLTTNEGCHEWAYEHKNGYRAVAAGYNMESDKDTRREEFKTVGANFDKVFNKEDSLNERQMVALTIFDAFRALARTGEHVKPFNQFCCSVRAVFADIMHSTGSMKTFPTEDMKQTVEKAWDEQYKSAAHELSRTHWCSKFGKRCDNNVEIVAAGC